MQQNIVKNLIKITCMFQKYKNMYLNLVEFVCCVVNYCHSLVLILFLIETRIDNIFG